MHPLHDYYLPRHLSAKIGDNIVQYYSKPGIPNWDRISPDLQLLTEHARVECNQHLWCINCGPGALAANIARQSPTISCEVSANDSLTLTCTELTRELNDLSNIQIRFDTYITIPWVECLDLILMCNSKGRSLNRRWLLQAWRGLKSGGVLLIAGANDRGIQSALLDARQLFNNYSLLAYKKGNRVAKFIKNENIDVFPDWASEPGIAPGTWHKLHINRSQTTIDLVSLPGVFSYTGIDEGTDLLITSLKNLSGEKILDIGCGYGIIGIYAALNGAESVDLVDSQLIAVSACQENIARNHLTICRAFLGDLLQPVKRNTYTCILSNPPFHAGTNVEYQITQAMISSAYDSLEYQGKLQLVANKFIRYDRVMQERFGNVEVLAQTSKYHVLASRKIQA